jgi:hypothetical protein
MAGNINPWLLGYGTRTHRSGVMFCSEDDNLIHSATNALNEIGTIDKNTN